MCIPTFNSTLWTGYSVPSGALKGSNDTNIFCYAKGLAAYNSRLCDAECKDEFRIIPTRRHPRVRIATNTPPRMKENFTIAGSIPPSSSLSVFQRHVSQVDRLLSDRIDTWIQTTDILIAPSRPHIRYRSVDRWYTLPCTGKFRRSTVASRSWPRLELGKRPALVSAQRCDMVGKTSVRVYGLSILLFSARVSLHWSAVARGCADIAKLRLTTPAHEKA